MRMTEYVPDATPRVTVQNLLLGSVSLLFLTVLLITLTNVAVSYRPVRGC